VDDASPPAEELTSAELLIALEELEELAAALDDLCATGGFDPPCVDTH
jgi:hypothetical protein